MVILRYLCTLHCVMVILLNFPYSALMPERTLEKCWNQHATSSGRQHARVWCIFYHKCFFHNAPIIFFSMVAHLF